MHPLSGRTEPWTITRREQQGANTVYTVVEDALANCPTLGDAQRYYHEMYAHDDSNGTEVIFTRSREFHVVRVERPQPPVTLRNVAVRA